MTFNDLEPRVFSRISCLGGVKLRLGVCWLHPGRCMPRILLIHGNMLLFLQQCGVVYYLDAFPLWCTASCCSLLLQVWLAVYHCHFLYTSGICRSSMLRLGTLSTRGFETLTLAYVFCRRSWRGKVVISGGHWISVSLVAVALHRYGWWWMGTHFCAIAVRFYKSITISDWEITITCMTEN